MIFGNHHQTTYSSLAFKEYYYKAQTLTHQMIRNPKLNQSCFQIEGRKIKYLTIIL